MKKRSNKTPVKNLIYGEIYKTAKQRTWSELDNNFNYITVPENEKLLFRSFKEYTKEADLALFFWMSTRKTICLSINKTSDCFIEIVHIKTNN